MKTRFAIALLAFAAAAAAADTKFAVADMDLVILSHPKTEDNRDKVSAMEQEAEAGHNQRRGELEALSEKIKAAAMDAQRPTSSPEARSQARADAEALRGQAEKKLAELREFDAAMSRKIRGEALARFAAIKEDVAEKLAAIAAEKGLDAVLDSAATRSGLPLPLVVWSSASVDITDELIAAVGGDRKAAEEALARGAARAFPGTQSGAAASDADQTPPRP